VRTRGVVYIHSAPLAVCSHIEWAIGRVLESPVRLQWSEQPVEPSARRAECVWSGLPGTGAQIAGALRQWGMTRFEVTEEPSEGNDGERYMHVPGRGLYAANTSASGDIVISEHRLRTIMIDSYGPESLAHELNKVLGTQWDLELEPYRQAGEGGPPVHRLHRVG
jgi:hypothetical protein